MKLTPELEADYRSKINPLYKEIVGTESYERDALFQCIDELRSEVAKLQIEVTGTNG